MGRVLQIRTRLGTISANSIRYISCAIAGDVHSTTEAPAQTPYRTAGSLSNLEAYLSTNSNNGTTTARSRINAGNGTLVASIATGTTGKFSDVTHSDNIADGDLVNYSIIAAGASGTIVGYHISSVFNATSGTSERMSAEMATNTLTTAATNYYWMPTNGSGGLQTNEALVKTKMKVAGTLKNLFIYVNTNSSSNSLSVFSRKNEGAGGLEISVTATSTGLFEDTANSQAVAVDDYINYRIYSGAGTPNINIRVVGSEFTPTTGSKVLIEGGIAAGGSLGQGSTGHPRFGTSFGSSTEYLQTAMIPMVLSNAFIYVSVNDCAASTFRTRISSGNGSLAASIGANSTGLFEDTANTDVVATTDDINFQYVIGAGATGITVIYFGCFAENIINKVLTETVTNTDVIIKATTKVLSSTITITASLLRSATKVLSETITLTASVLHSMVKVLSDTVTITASSIQSTIRVLSEIITITASSIASSIKVLTETITITASNIVTMAKTFLDTITLTDTISSIMIFLKEVLDTINISDTISRSINAVRTEIISITDSISSLIGKILTETITITDSIIENLVYVKEFLESISISDTISKATARVISETVTITDTFSRMLTKTLEIMETITMTASVAVSKILSRTYSEIITITDSIMKVKLLATYIFGKISGVLFSGKIDSDKEVGKIDDINFNGKIK